MPSKARPQAYCAEACGGASRRSISAGVHRPFIKHLPMFRKLWTSIKFRKRTRRAAYRVDTGAGRSRGPSTVAPGAPVVAGTSKPGRGEPSTPAAAPAFRNRMTVDEVARGLGVSPDRVRAAVGAVAAKRLKLQVVARCIEQIGIEPGGEWRVLTVPQLRHLVTEAISGQSLRERPRRRRKRRFSKPGAVSRPGTFGFSGRSQRLGRPVTKQITHDNGERPLFYPGSPLVSGGGMETKRSRH